MAYFVTFLEGSLTLWSVRQDPILLLNFVTCYYDISVISFAKGRFSILHSGGSRISTRRGRQLPGGHQQTILPNFPKNCMKLKEFGPPDPLDPPLFQNSSSQIISFLASLLDGNKQQALLLIDYSRVM